MSLSCKEIVEQLGEYIIGQDEAKKMVAIALRNRSRRSKLSAHEREEITPKNIIMKGPTGVGKTEIARRLAKLVNAPFVKVEATKYTEVGYVGRDVESMIRDLVETSIRLVKDERAKDVRQKVEKIVETKLLDLIISAKHKENPELKLEDLQKQVSEDLANGKSEDYMVESTVVAPQKQMEIGIGNGAEINIGEIFGGFLNGSKKTKRRLTVSQFRDIFISEESDKLIDQDNVISEAITRAEQDGIIFIDEFDKIVSKGKGNSNGGPEVSREGVQRDILPIVEGSTVSTKYGIVKTDYILFIAAGAFHISKIEDLIPEIQGRFPIRVELNSLNKEDFYRILTEPKNNLIHQYSELLKVDNIDLDIKEDAIKELSAIAQEDNENHENIGARRLQAIMETLLEEIMFTADAEKHPLTKVVIDRAYVKNIFDKLQKDNDLKKYIL